MGSARILVADNDPGALESLRCTLGTSGFDVSVADRHDALLAELERAKPDLLVLDISMPGLDGVPLLQRVRGDRRWRDIPVLIVSSLSPDEMTERTFGLGAADIIRKPFRPPELVARVQAQLRLYRMLRATQRTLRSAEEELQRARDDAASRRKVVDILHEVTGDLSSGEICHILARRVARALRLSRCSIILAKPGDAVGLVAAAFDNPGLRDFRIHLERYPEIQRALALGRPVLVEDLRSHPLFAEVREQWRVNGTQVLSRSVITLPFLLGDMPSGVFFLRRRADEPPLATEDVEFADTVIKAAVAAIHRAQVIETTRADNARLEVLAHTDALTQVLNRRALTMRLESEMERARRYASVITVLMIDLDHFKNINDTKGHLVGDDVLRELAALLSESVRTVDLVARFGGEEFVVMLPETGLPGGVRFAERTVERIGARNFVPAHGGAHVTSSIGVASFPGPGVESVDDLFSRADEALYRAKAAGRNKVCT
ncbi:MAG TPA: diguanylate cyclase [Gemmatimonadaceae bacterium]|nr:diguanylate cyclase [Gemmatimonadaceae bacterium]